MNDPTILPWLRQVLQMLREGKYVDAALQLREMIQVLEKEKE